MTSNKVQFFHPFNNGTKLKVANLFKPNWQNSGTYIIFSKKGTLQACSEKKNCSAKLDSTITIFRQLTQFVSKKHKKPLMDQERFWPYSIISRGCRLHEQACGYRVRCYFASVAAKGKRPVYISTSFFDFPNTLSWSAHNHWKHIYCGYREDPENENPLWKENGLMKLWETSLKSYAGASRPKPKWNDLQCMKNSIFNTVWFSARLSLSSTSLCTAAPVHRDGCTQARFDLRSLGFCSSN